MDQEALTHTAFLSLWSFWTRVAREPRDACGDTRIPQSCFPPRAGSQGRAAHDTSHAIRGYTPGVPGSPRSPVGTERKARSQRTRAHYLKEPL